MNKIGQAIRDNRIAHGLTLEAAAERANCEPDTWRYIERGRVTLPEADVFRGVCQAVEIDPEDLLRKAGYLW